MALPIMKYFAPLGLVLALFLPPLPGRAAEELCPEGDAAQRAMPGDVAGVQADIARLNLCVERAVLLKQLDDIAKQRAATLDKMTSADSEDVSRSIGGVGGIPPMPVSALPVLPVTTQEVLQGGKAGGKPAAKIKNAAGSPLMENAPENAPRAASNGWKLRKIWGGLGAMRAQVTDGAGALLNVMKGDPLPDGAVVGNVSVKGVTISQNGKINDLPWDEMSDSGSSPKNAAKNTP